MASRPGQGPVLHCLRGSGAVAHPFQATLAWLQLHRRKLPNYSTTLGIIFTTVCLPSVYDESSRARHIVWRDLKLENCLVNSKAGVSELGPSQNKAASDS